MKHILITLFILGLISCEPFDYRLKLINNTNKKIRYFYKVMNEEDTIPVLKNCDKYSFDYISPKTEEIIRTSEKWQFQLKKPNEILRVYMINEDTFKKYRTVEYINGEDIHFEHDSLHKYDMCDVLKKQIFMKRYDLRYSDLVKIGWQIIYDGK